MRFAHLSIIALALVPLTHSMAQTIWSKEQLAARVEEIREETFLHPVEWKTIPRRDGVEMMLREFRRAVPTEIDEPLHRILSVMGMVPQERSLESLVWDLFHEQLGGFYDSGAKRLYVIDDEDTRAASSKTAPQALDPERRRLILLHELTHALVDQHSPLEEWLDLPLVQRSLDAALLRSALVEGEAGLVMQMADLVRLGQSPDHETLKLPQSIEEMDLSSLIVPSNEHTPWIHLRFVLPYDFGLAWIARRWQEGGWASVEAIRKHPPPSVEAIVHGTGGFARQRDPRLPDLHPGERPVLSLEFGEVGLAVWLAGVVGPERAVRAAAGWAGDRAVLVRKRRTATSGGAGDRLVLSSSWDSRADADQFASAAQSWLRAHPQLEWTIERHSYWVTLAITPPERDADHAIDVEEDPWDRVIFGPAQ